MQGHRGTASQTEEIRQLKTVKRWLKNDMTHHTQLQLRHLISAYGKKQS